MGAAPYEGFACPEFSFSRMTAPLSPGPDDEIVKMLIKHPGRRWCLVQTRARNEKFSAWNCANRGIITYIPLITKTQVHNRSKRTILLPMFPGYFFSCPALDEQTLIRREKGVWNLRILDDCGEDALLRDLLKVRESELLSSSHQLIVNPGLHPGDKVRIQKGPFKNHDVVVIRRENAAQVIINLDFLGQNLEMLWNADELVY